MPRTLPAANPPLPSGVDRHFFALLRFYGVPQRIIHTLQHHYTLPKPYSLNEVPKELPNPWLHLYGETGSGKSTRAAFLLALYLRARARLGRGIVAIQATDENHEHYNQNYRPKGSYGTAGRCLYVRVTDLLRRMKSDFGSGHNAGSELFQACLEAEFLVLDDLTGQPSQWELSQLDLLIDKRYGDGSYTIVTSNHAPSQIDMVLSERIKGRMSEIAQALHIKGSYR